MKATKPPDTTKPFIAIVPLKRSGYFNPTHSVYLINPLDEPLTNVYEELGGWFSDEDGVIHSEPNRKGPYTVKPHSKRHLETSSMDEFDEFTCWWEISYDVKGKSHRVQFSAGRGLNSTVPIEICPILNRRALLPT